MMPSLMSQAHASLVSKRIFLQFHLTSAILVLSLGSLEITSHTSLCHCDHHLHSENPDFSTQLPLFYLMETWNPKFTHVLPDTRFSVYLLPFTAYFSLHPTFNYLNTLPAGPQPKRRVLILHYFFYTQTSRCCWR